MKRAYDIPCTFPNVQDYFDYITSLPIAWECVENDRQVFADGTGYVEIDGQLPQDFHEVPLRGQE